MVFAVLELAVLEQVLVEVPVLASFVLFGVLVGGLGLNLSAESASVSVGSFAALLFPCFPNMLFWEPLPANFFLPFALCFHSAVALERQPC